MRGESGGSGKWLELGLNCRENEQPMDVAMTMSRRVGRGVEPCKGANGGKV